MKKFNKYGFVSGGYIADKMDREALGALNKEYPVTKKELWFTADCHIEFYKQLCSTKKIRFNAFVMAFFAWQTSVDIEITLFQENAQIATGWFTFTKARHNFCKTKGV